MTERSLQVTYRKGRTFAAYLHLSHPTGEKSARTVASPDGPAHRRLRRVNLLLAELGEPPLAEQDYRPARAA